MTTPTLEGRRVRLEPLTLAHLPALEQVALGPDAPRIWRHFRDTIKTPQHLRTWVDRGFDRVGAQQIVAKSVNRSAIQFIEPVECGAQRFSLICRRSVRQTEPEFVGNVAHEDTVQVPRDALT